MTGDLPRKLGLLDATSIVAGTMIGVGLFLVPAALARETPSAFWILAVWTVTGLISLCGALAYAELGAMLPHSGGQYVYLREAYGPLPAFLAGWAFFLVINSGSIAAVSTGFGLYLQQFLPAIPAWLSACVMITALSAINYVGVKQGARVQILFLVLKLSGIALLLGGAAFLGKPTQLAFAASAPVSASAVGAAMLMAFVAYDGWHMVAFVAGEVKNPKRNLPLALMLGVSGVVAVYVIVNIAYLHVMPLATMMQSERIAADTAAATRLGPLGATLITLTILLSCIGAGNGAILTSPRIYFAQARDGLLFARFGEVHPRYLTPSFSIVAHCVWTCLLSLSGSYEVLVGYVMFISWMIHAATVLAVLVLRRKRPDLARPYRMWGYPVAPMLFFAFAAWFVGNTLWTRPASSLAGAALLLLGVPVYYYWRRNSPAPRSLVHEAP